MLSFRQSLILTLKNMQFIRKNRTVFMWMAQYLVKSLP